MSVWQVLPGKGFRVSLVLANHDVTEEGVRYWDMKPVGKKSKK